MTLPARQGLKIIAGLQTFAPERVRHMCNAAVAGVGLVWGLHT